MELYGSRRISSTGITNPLYMTDSENGIQNIKGRCYGNKAVPESNPLEISEEKGSRQKKSINRNLIRRKIKDLKQLECKQHVLKEKGECYCGHKCEINEGEKNKDQKWSVAENIVKVPCNSYGTIEFLGFGQENKKNALYVRVEKDTELDKLWNFLHDGWNMTRPRLIISVTGGAKRFYMKPRLSSLFKRGLINAATSTGAWIVTGGTHAGVMQFVGEAVHEHSVTAVGAEQNVVALGIATWSCIDNNKALVSKDTRDTKDIKHGCFPAKYHCNQLSPNGTKGFSSLDYNHTHFILVDSGEKKYGAEIDMRAKLEGYIHNNTGKSKNSNSGDQSKIPIVLLVLEGGINTLKTVVESIGQGTVVVVIGGSGRVADFIATAYMETKHKDNEDETSYPNEEKHYTERLRKRIIKIFKPKEQGEIEECIKGIKTCLEKRHLLTIFQIGDDSDSTEIDQAILHALLKAEGKAEDTSESQLHLALAWNRCDVARQKIFTLDRKDEWKKMKLQEALFKALREERTDFVHLFIDCGVDVKSFLTAHQLRELYDEVILKSHLFGVSAILMSHQLDEVCLTWHSQITNSKPKIANDMDDLLLRVGYVISKMLRSSQAPYYQEKKYLVPVPTKEKKNSSGETVPVHVSENPFRELLLWAVLLNRRALALLFWQLGSDQIGAAMTASFLLKSLSKEADREEEIDLAADLLRHSEEFEARAIGVLNICYQKDKILSHQLLTRELTSWGNSTLFSIADAAQQMSFMGHSCCQTKLNRIWKGKMALLTTIPLILVTLVFQFPMFWIMFVEDEDGRTNEENEEEEDSEPDSSTMKYTTHSQFHGSVSPSPEEKRNKSSTVNDDKKKKLNSVGLLWGRNSIGALQALRWYHTAPITKFCYHTLSYAGFLFLFSYFVMTDLHDIAEPNSPSFMEYIIWGWATTLLLEEFRQLFARDISSMRYRMQSYFDNYWNRIDLVNFVLLITAIILRYRLTGEDFVWARMCYCTTLTIYFLRSMQVFFVAKNIGPKIIMIKRMMVDLLFFICILTIFILAYGVSSQALRYPNSKPSLSLVKDVLYLPYWQMYGELFLDDLEGDVGECSSNATIWKNVPGVKQCPEVSTLSIILFAFYMIMTNVLLLNLLIAMFSHTFERVQEMSEQVWRYYRYNLVYEYFDRPALAPPLIIFSHIARVIKFIYRRYKHDMRNTIFRQKLSHSENAKLTTFEKTATEIFLSSQMSLSREQTDNRVKAVGDRIERVIEDLEQLKENVTGLRDESGHARSETTPIRSEVTPIQVQPIVNSSFGAGDAAAVQELHDEVSSLHDRISGLESFLETQNGLLRSILSSVSGPKSGGTSLRRIVEPTIEVEDLLD